MLPRKLENCSVCVKCRLGKNVGEFLICLLGAFDHAFKGNPQATPEDIVNAAKLVAEATALLVSACNNSPEEISAAAKNTHQSTKALLENAKGAVRLTDDTVCYANHYP
jgi:I/LWEQ domain